MATCTCGCDEDNHGHDLEFPGSTACRNCEEGGCIAFERDTNDDEEGCHE